MTHHDRGALLVLRTQMWIRVHFGPVTRPCFAVQAATRLVGWLKWRRVSNAGVQYRGSIMYPWLQTSGHPTSGYETMTLHRDLVAVRASAFMKTALLTGITGQDGSFLTEFLLSKGYEVHGIVRRASTFNTGRLDGLYTDPHSGDARLFLHYGDLTDGTSLRRIMETVQPEEIYNLGAQSHVRVSFEQSEYTADVVGTGTLRLLECIRDYSVRSGRSVRFYQAGSSEMFGGAVTPQSETTPFYPRSPYAVSKVAAHWYCVNYREAYKLFICNGILFNHESERRGETFVTRKITRALTRISLGLQDKLYLGNLEAKRDWGYAADYVQAMWLMLQQETPDDYVVATGESHSVREFLDAAAEYASVDWRRHVEIDPIYLRPTEVEFLLGDATKARTRLGWAPQVTFTELVKRMIEHDLELAKRQKTLIDAGHAVV